MLVQEVLVNSAKRLPDKVALICDNHRLTYQQLNDFSDNLADGFLDMGIKRQDRVVIFLDNSIESVISLFAILKVGAIFIMLNSGMKAKKLSYILQDSGARAIITDVKKVQVITEADLDASEIDHIIWCSPAQFKFIPLSVRQLNEDETIVSHATSKFKLRTTINHSWNEICAKTANRDFSAFSPVDHELATIIYTSGSTGKPKGVMSAHYNMLAAASSIIQFIENMEDDIILNVLPLHFDYGLYQVLMAFFFGGTVVLEKSFAYPYRIVERIIDEKITGLPIVPTIAALLLQIKEFDKFDLSHVRYITNTADVLPIEYIRKMRKIFPFAKIFSMYGLTECKRVCYLPPEELDFRPRSVGKPMPNVEAFVIDEFGREVDSGVTGELVVRGPNVMQGYWKDPEETERVFRKGQNPEDTLLYTGDLFRKDKEGFLYFVARKDDLIKVKGQRVSLKEIENVLCEFDNVVEAAAIGIPDETVGHSIRAVIVSENQSLLNKDLIFDYCRKNLESFMVPSHIEFRSILPKLSNGKIDREQLKISLQP